MAYWENSGCSNINLYWLPYVVSDDGIIYICRQVKIHNENVVSTFTPRRSHISGARFTRSPLLASRLPAGRRSAPWDRAMAGLLLFVDSLLNRCYLLVSGSVRVRRGVVGRLGG